MLRIFLTLKVLGGSIGKESQYISVNSRWRKKTNLTPLKVTTATSGGKKTAPGHTAPRMAERWV
jgi:hypothetical protein